MTELQRCLDVSARTVARDIKLLRQSGFNVESSPRGFSCITGAGSAFAQLRECDVENLALIGVFLRSARELPFSNTVSETLARILARYPEADTCVQFRGSSYDSTASSFGHRPKTAAIFTQLAQAIKQQQLCLVEVEDKQYGGKRFGPSLASTKLTILPAILECYSGTWLIRGIEAEEQSNVELEINQIQHVEPIMRTLSYNLRRRAQLIRLSPRSRSRTARRTVRAVLHIDAKAPRYLQEIEWEPGQSVHQLLDGRVEIAFHAPINDALVHRLLLHLKHVTAVEPPELRTRLLRVAQQITARYLGDPCLNAHFLETNYRLEAKRRTSM